MLNYRLKSSAVFLNPFCFLLLVGFCSIQYSVDSSVLNVNPFNLDTMVTAKVKFYLVQFK